MDLKNKNTIEIENEFIAPDSEILENEFNTLKHCLLNLSEKKSIEYLSIASIFNKEHIVLLENSDTNYFKKIKEETTYSRNHLSLKEKIILDMLNKKYAKYYLIILYYYIYDDNNDIYLDLLKSMKKSMNFVRDGRGVGCDISEACAYMKPDKKEHVVEVGNA